MLSVRIKGSAVRIAIICGTETCGWLRTERDVEWKLWMKAVYAKHHRSQDAVRQNLPTTGKRFCGNRKLLSNFTLYSMM